MNVLLRAISFAILSTGLWALGCDGGSTTCGGDALTAPYPSCDHLSPDGSCARGSCAVSSPEKEVFQEWKKQVEALSGYDDQQLFQRVQIEKVAVDSASSVWVEIDYGVVLDWISYARHEVVDLGPPPLNVTPAAITAAVKLGIQAMNWSALAKTPKVASEAEVKAAFDSCGCDVAMVPCYVDVVDDKLSVHGSQLVPEASKCLFARVDLGTGALTECHMISCGVK